jgi:hypothetical protein
MNTNSVLCTCSYVFQETSLTVSFVRELRNRTIIYKPNAFVYHLCQTSTSMINSKRIRWHYEPLNDSESLCQNRLNNSDCFDFYYGPSTSVLVVKEPDLFMGKYMCRITFNSTYELKSIGWIDVKLPANEISTIDEHDDDDDDEQRSAMFDENELSRLARYYHVPFISDENDLIGFGRRVEIGGLFHSQCRSVASSSSISFTWLHLRTRNNEKLKSMQFIEHDGKRIHIHEETFSSRFSLDFKVKKTKKREKSQSLIIDGDTCSIAVGCC